MKNCSFMWRRAGKCIYRLLETFWVAPIGYWQPFGKGPNSMGDIVVNAFREVETICEMPNLKWRPVGRISCRVSRCSHWLSVDEKNAKKSIQPIGNKAFRANA
jgi:hypothetical protein